jgi:hypothetical protein
MSAGSIALRPVMKPNVRTERCGKEPAHLMADRKQREAGRVQEKLAPSQAHHL